MIADEFFVDGLHPLTSCGFFLEGAEIGETLNSTLAFP